MKIPELKGALKGLKYVDVSDLENYKLAVTNGKQIGFAYYFAGLLTQNKTGRKALLLYEDDGSLCVFRWVLNNSKPKLDIQIAPTPMNPNVLTRCFQRANDFNGDTTARLLKVDEKDLGVLSELPNIQVKKRKSQYLYAPGNFGNLSGGKFRTVRRYVSKIKSMENVEVHPYSKIYLDSCLNLLGKWGERHKQMHGTFGGFGTTRRLIQLADKIDHPDLIGEVVLIDKKLVGFAFGGEIRPGVAAFLDVKSDFEIRGLSYFQRYSFISKLNQYSIVNDGPDIGRQGLALLKNNLRPVGMHQEYRVFQSS